jgi:hypothetical protein
MGATQFIDTTRAYSMGEAYDQLVEDAVNEYGHDSYNGTISTTQGFKDITSEWKKSGISIDKFIDLKIEDANKWGHAFGVCVSEPIKNKLKVKSQVEHVVVPGTKRWELRYFILDKRGNKIASEDNKVGAVKAARIYTEKTQENTTVIMERVLVSCSPVVARIKFKHDKDQKSGAYYFFGYAAN